MYFIFSLSISDFSNKAIPRTYQSPLVLKKGHQPGVNVPLRALFSSFKIFSRIKILIGISHDLAHFTLFNNSAIFLERKIKYDSDLSSSFNKKKKRK